MPKREISKREIDPVPEAATQPFFKKRKVLIAIAMVIIVCCAVVGIVALRHFMPSQLTQRNSQIDNALDAHHVVAITVPTSRAASLHRTLTSSTKILPLRDCVNPTNKQDVKTLANSFAYLLTYDDIVAHQPRCSLAQVTKVLGRPNSSAVIAGSYSTPKELLLFYDRGAQKSAAQGRPMSKEPASVVPIDLNQLPAAGDCASNTVVNVVAHQDDDLLFLSPDLLHDIQAGRCVRTIYLTAGDAGRGSFYWLQREQGSKAAYSYMTPQAADDLWIDRIAKVGDKAYATVSTPRTNPKISLIFLHLPDGNVTGGGFRGTKSQSLQKLLYGSISTISSVDKQSTYTSDQLQTAITNLVAHYKPLIIRTQSAQRQFKNDPYIDHSDHGSVGIYMERVYRQLDGANQGIGLNVYVGYPIRTKPANLRPADMMAKEQTFLQYASHDSSVCQTASKCDTAPDYSAYLKRQYQADY